jgi:PAS domain S-box-containing protein
LPELVSPPGRAEETAAEMARLQQRVFAGERVEPFDAVRSRKDGSLVQVSMTVTPLKDSSGAIVGSIGIARDISARLAIEAELRAERERSQDFAEAASDWFWETDPELRMSFISTRFTELTGVPAAKRLGRPWTDVPHDDPEKWRELAAIFAARRPFRDFRFTRPGADGTKREISASGKPRYGRDGAFLGYRGTGRDVTQEIDARRAAEQAETRLRAALGNIAEGFALFDADDRLLFCNGQYRVLSGRAAEMLAPGVKFEDYLRAGLAGGEMPEAIGAEEDWLRRRLAYHRAPAGPLELLRSGRWLRLVETRLPDGGTILIAADITDERRREQRLREAQKMEAIGRLTGGVAHDFNNLLAVILGNTELLEERLQGDPEAGRLARTSIRAALRGAELTQRLLAFARRQPLKPEPTDLNQLVAGVAELLRRTLGANIELQTRLADGLPRIEADPGQLENALLNLAFNARDAMPAGGHLTIATGQSERAPEVEGAGGFVTAAVTDSGVGMTAEVAGRAFEPFFTTKEPGKGSGLGLSMVDGFARQSSGGLALESAPGKGTTITLYLPRSTKRGERASEETHEPPADGGERVLLVEDADDVRELARTMLEGLGYSVVEARDGPAAYALLEGADRFDLLLTDVMLPGGVNGADLARNARDRWPGLKVLCMSGYSEQAPRLAIGDARLPLLGKPFRRAELAKAIREALAS